MNNEQNLIRRLDDAKDMDNNKGFRLKWNVLKLWRRGRIRTDVKGFADLYLSSRSHGWCNVAAMDGFEPPLMVYETTTYPLGHMADIKRRPGPEDSGREPLV